MSVTVSHDASLRHLNSFGIQASANRLIEVNDDRDLDQAIELCGDSGPELILGGGSNLLIVAPIRGTVLRLAAAHQTIIGQADGLTIVEAAAGCNWHSFVGWTLAQGLAGLENLSLIPGTVGAAPIQNIGAYGLELAERFDSLTAIHLPTGVTRIFNRAECQFGYRDSVFKQPPLSQWLIRTVRFALAPDLPLRTDYGEIGKQLARDGVQQPHAVDVANAVVTIRRRRLPDPAIIGNAGSFFKNPLISISLAEQLHVRFSDLPRFPSNQPSDSRVKLSAAWLIEQCGWKGQRRGDAGVYQRHALVLVNHGNATGRDLLSLAQEIRDSVQQRFGVTLEPEPIIVPVDKQ